MDGTIKTTQQVNGVTVTATHYENGVIFFSCGPNGREGFAKWVPGEGFVKVKQQVGSKFQAAIKAVFKL